MRLKWRLTLVFLLMAWVPLAGAVWLLGDRMEDTVRASYASQRDAAVAAVRARFSELTRDLRAALEGVAADPVLGETLLEPLARGVFHGDQERERALVREAERLLTSPALDTLRVIDRADAGRVLAMGHRRGVEPPDGEAARLAREAPGAPVLRRERIENASTGAAEPRWTLQVVHPVDARVALVGGRVLDRAVMADLLSGSAGGAAAALESAAGERVSATFTGDAPPRDPAGYDALERTLVQPGSGTPVALLRVWVSRAELHRTVRQLWTAAGVLGGLSGLVALFAGLWISRRISRPLEDLAEAARAVAAGDRDRRVPELAGRDEVASLTRAFNQMTDDLAASEVDLRRAERIAAWRDIARRIAHEIKNPLFPIQTAIETLKKVHQRRHPDFEAIFDESTETILEEVGRMKRIVTEFSDFARMPALQLAETDVAELVRQVVGLHRDVAEGVAVQAAGPDRLDAVVDADRLRQLVTNLVKNALEAHAGGSPAAEGARVDVRLAAAGDRVALEVADNGPGLPDEVRERLFTPYVTTKAGGTGLGLAIVHRIVSEHGGRVDVKSEAGVGTAIVVQIPRSGPEVASGVAPARRVVLR